VLRYTVQLAPPPQYYSLGLWSGLTLAVHDGFMWIAYREGDTKGRINLIKRKNSTRWSYDTNTYVLQYPNLCAL